MTSSDIPVYLQHMTQTELWSHMYATEDINVINVTQQASNKL